MNEVTIHDHVVIPISGGRKLSARMWQPKSDVPLPVIVESHPYPHAYATATRDEINHGYFAAHGYVALRVDTPGSGDSDGQMSDQYQAEEHAAVLEVLDWVRAQPWCDGSLGMFGHSWGAYSSLQVAALQPEGLKAIVFSGASDNLYTEDCNYCGGVQTTENMGWASTLLSFLTRPPTSAGFGPERTKKWVERLEKLEWILPTWLSNAARTDYWHQGSVCDDYSRVQVPVLMASGWADTYPSAVLRMAEHLPGTFVGVLGPWAHKFPHMGMPGPAIGWLQEAVAWWDRWLKGADNGADKQPRLRAFIEEDTRPDPMPDGVRAGRWVAEAAWPPAHPLSRSFFLKDQSLTGEAGTGQVTIASPADTGLDAGELMPMAWGADLPGDQRGDDGKSVCFDSAVLTEPLDVLGRIVLEATLTSDVPTGFLAARVCDIHPDGASTRVAFRAHNLTHSADHASVTPLTPGAPVRLRLELDATGYRFLPGHRIRLALSNAYWPLLWPAREVGSLTLDLASAKLTLPGPSADCGSDVVFQPAEGATPRPRTQLATSEVVRSATSEMASGETSFYVKDVSAREHDRHSGLTFWGTTERTYKVAADLSTASMLSLREVNLLDGGRHLQTFVTAKLSSDAAQFYSDVTLVALEDGQEVVRRQWHDKIPQ